MVVHHDLVSGTHGCVVPVELPLAVPQEQHVDADLDGNRLQLRQVLVAPIFKPGRELDALTQFVW